MKRYERSIKVVRPVEAVFDYFADMSHIPDWCTEDFVSVEARRGWADRPRKPLRLHHERSARWVVVRVGQV